MPQSIPTPILSGAGGLSKFVLAAPDGARAEIYLQGSHITSWIPAGGTEQLFLSRTASFAPGDPIRGGVPVCWPQFSGEGPLQPHGFARNVAWQLVGVQANPDKSATATLRLSDSGATRALWPHPFAAEMAVTVGGRRLHMTFAVTNTGSADFTFSGALHTYLRLADVHNTTVEGFAGVPYKNTFTDRLETPQVERLTRFGPEGAGRVCYGAQKAIVREGTRAITLTNENFPDIVLWNPGVEKAARIPDLEPDGYRHMLCIEAGVVGSPVRLPPGQSWRGGQRIRIETRHYSDQQTELKTGGGAVVAGNVSTGNDFIGRDKVGGDRISVGHISNSQGIAIGRNSLAQVAREPSSEDLKQLFAPLFKAVRVSPAIQKEANAKVAALKTEVAKGLSSDDQNIASIIDDLTNLVPDITDDIVDLFSANALSQLVGDATRYVLAKIHKK